jgi:hypothetical protein
MINKDTQMRELAYIVQVGKVEPIAGADNIELIHVNGWVCIAKIGEFKENDLAVYFEIDSKLPEDAKWAEFMASKHYKVKTMKLGKFKVISQGLTLPVSAFGWEETVDESGEKIIDTGLADERYLRLGDFVTKRLKVVYSVKEDNVRKSAGPDKYKAMAARHQNLFKKKPFRWLMRRTWGKKLLFVFFGRKKDNRKGFPSHLQYISKSDEERCENMPWILDNKTPFRKTVKIDGTSTLFLLERKKFGKNEFYVCSRNVRQLDESQATFHEENVYWAVANKFKMREVLTELLVQHPEWDYVAIQGETAGCGSSGCKIQGDPHKFGELRFFAYNFIDSQKGRWDSVDGRDLLAGYGIEWVPIVDENYILPDDFEEFKLSADGACEAPGASGLREGYVYRNVDDPYLSFKNVSRKYLLKHNE